MTTSLFSNSLLTDIALTLIHFLWQGLLVAAALKLILVYISERKPHIKYLFATLAMTANFILPLLTFYLISQSENNQALTVNNSKNEQLLNLPLFSQQPDFLTTLQAYLPYLTVLWIVTIALLSSRLLVQMYQVNQLPKTKINHQFKELDEHFLCLVKKLQLKRIPKLVVSLSVQVPMAIGWLKPVVMLPASMVSGLTSEQLEMLFLHELAHIKRHDYLVNFIQSIVEILFFFHPAVHWVSKQMRVEREYCSDDIAVKHCGDALAYAHTLADTASICRKHHHHAIPIMAMAATGGELKNRIVRLVNQHHCTSTLNKSKWLAAILISCTLIVLSTQYLSQTLHLLEEQEMQVPSKIALISELEKPVTLFTTQTITQKSKNPSLIDDVVLNKKEIKITVNEIIKPEKLQTNENKTALQDVDVINSKPIINEFSVETSIEEVKPTPVITKVNNVKIKTAEKQKTDYKKSTSTHELTSKKLANTVVQEIAQNNSKVLSKKVALIQQQPLKTSHLLINSPTNENMKLSFAKNVVLASDVRNVDEESEVFKNAEAISIIDPKYPSRAEFKGVELDLLVNFSIDENGKVTNIKIEKKHKSRYFRSEIIKALAQWKFLPAQENGQPVASNMSKIFSFNLESTS